MGLGCSASMVSGSQVAMRTAWMRNARATDDHVKANESLHTSPLQQLQTASRGILADSWRPLHLAESRANTTEMLQHCSCSAPLVADDLDRSTMLPQARAYCSNHPTACGSPTRKEGDLRLHACPDDARVT